MEYYMLKNGEPEVVTMEEWAKATENNKYDPHVAETDIGEVRVSTVLLPFDHSHTRGVTSIFETTIFGGTHGGKMWRCGTVEDARQQHDEAVDLVERQLEVQ